jgi:hypothetical protein
MDDLNQTKAREPYEPPMIEDVPVRAEEQILAGCKQLGGNGLGAFFGCNLVSCSTPSAS